MLVLTMHSDDAHLRHALHAGASGYLLKDAEPDSIIRAIVAVNEGQAIFDRGIAPRVIAASGTPPQERPFPVLTDREYEILDRLARGLRNDAISARMGISMKTVQNNVSTILLKLGAADRAQAVALARDAGMGRRPSNCLPAGDLGFPSKFLMRFGGCLVPPGNGASEREIARPPGATLDKGVIMTDYQDTPNEAGK